MKTLNIAQRTEGRLFKRDQNSESTFVCVNTRHFKINVSNAQVLIEFSLEKSKTSIPTGINLQNNQIICEPLAQGIQAYDAEAEVGIVRNGDGGEDEVVHVWPNVDQSKTIDLRLIRIDRGAKEDLIFKIFNRTANSDSIAKLNNYDSLHINGPVKQQIEGYRFFDLVEVHKDNTQRITGVSLWKDAIDGPYGDSFQGLNLMNGDLGAMTRYIQTNILVLKDAGREVAKSDYISRVFVERIPNYQFEFKKISAIHVNIERSMSLKVASSIWRILLNPLIGLCVPDDAKRTYQLEGVNERDLVDLFSQSRNRGLTLDQRKEIIRDIDRTIYANASIDYYIAVDRSIAIINLGKDATYYISSVAAGFGIYSRKALNKVGALASTVGSSATSIATSAQLVGYPLPAVAAFGTAAAACGTLVSVIERALPSDPEKLVALSSPSH